MSADRHPMRRIANVLADQALRHELIERASRDAGLPKAAQFSVDTRKLREMLETDDRSGEQFDTRQFSEAIVLEVGRPALLVRNDLIEVPLSDEWKKRLSPFMPKLAATVKSVGRIELIDHPDFEWVGTGWLIDENILVTNRHVAVEFARRGRQGFAFIENLDGKPVRAQIDFKEEYRVGQSREIAVDKILYIANDGPKDPDVAFLKVVSNGPLPSPLQLETGSIQGNATVGVIGYPARDSRNDTNAMVKVFGDIYNVKRFSPGQITASPDGSWFFGHDCSTLGGNSGSAVVHVESGKVVGLHFSGRFRMTNYAVRADSLRKLLPKIGVKMKGKAVSRPQPPAPAAIEEKQQSISAYKNKSGYDPSFLGDGAKLALPKVRDENSVLTLDRGMKVLDYTHFSVIMHATRRLPILTAVNIDGSQRRFISRKGQTWYFDPRIPRKAQVGAEFYGPTVFDRGHMVRREDPIWGQGNLPATANEDTFHYTNACPQHPDLNQKTWLELENYILDATDVRDLRVCVFTGPVLDDNDPDIEGVKVPLQFWKVAAVIDDASGKLATAGYIQSQKPLVSDMEFRFGAFKTYQVPVRRIEQLTGLDFGKQMRSGDGLQDENIDESLGGGTGSIEIRGSQDIRLGAR